MTPTKVLLVDDELSLLQLLERYLVKLGFEVRACSQAEDALKCFEADPQAYPLVMVDLTLPGMSGEELLRRILQVSDTVRATVCSGYPVNLSVFPEASQWRLSFLQKPFVPRMLAETLRDMLSRQPDTAATPPHRKAD